VDGRDRAVRTSAAELGSKAYSIRAKYNANGDADRDLTMHRVRRLQVATTCRTLLKEMKTTFPTGLDSRHRADTTDFVRESINEVVHTFIEAVVLV